jgi:hypothetical protein
MYVCNRINKYPFIWDAPVAKRFFKHKEQNPSCKKLIRQEIMFPNAIFYFSNARIFRLLPLKFGEWVL